MCNNASFSGIVNQIMMMKMTSKNVPRKFNWFYSIILFFIYELKKKNHFNYSYKVKKYAFVQMSELLQQ